MAQRFLALFVLCCLLTPALSVANETAATKPQKSPELRYLEGLACLQQSDTGCAQVALAGLNPASPYAKILEAQIAASGQNFDSALRLLIPLQAENDLLPQAIGSLHATLALAYENQDNPLRAVEQRALAEPFLTDNAAVEANQRKLWENLAAQPREMLLEMRGESANTTIQGWVDLALAINFNERREQAIAQWRQAYPDHPVTDAVLAMIAGSNDNTRAISGSLSGKVAVLLPLETPAYAAATDAIRRGIVAAHEAQQSSAELTFYASGSGKEEMLAVYQQALVDGAQYVIGPMTRDEVNALADSTLVSVTTLALNQPEVKTAAMEKLLAFGRPVEAETRQIADIGRGLGMQSALVIYAETPLGERMANSFIAAWTESGGNIRHKASFKAESDLAALRADVAAHAADMIFLAADVDQARLVRPYLDQATPTFGMSHLYDGDPANPLNAVLNAVHFIDMPWLVDPENPAFKPYKEVSATLAPGEAQRWFAVGVDAWRLLADSAQNERQPLQGLTGNLRWQDGQPQRDLSKAQFRHGSVVAEPLP